MKTKERLPIAVENLRKIWESKKHELELTQNIAAENLGMTQGAFSQYLNGITELGPQAVLKLAKFFDVDPVEIDPSIAEHLPNVHRIPILYEMHSSKIVKDRYAAVKIEGTFRVEVDGSKLNQSFKKRYPWIGNNNCQLVCQTEKDGYRPRVTGNELMYLLLLKEASHFDLFVESEVPPAKKIQKKFLVLGVVVY
jgi:transcriptional regulator with XRE-family HTH domain